MRIEGIGAAFPSKCVTNKDILSLICKHSQTSFSGDRSRTLRRIERYLEHSGAQTRFWLDDRETPRQLIRTAFALSLDKAGLRPDDIDLVVYCGIGRGFAEPGNAYLIAQDLELRNPRCLDIVDACNGWCTTIDIIPGLAARHGYRHAAIFAPEFNMIPGGYVYPALFELSTAEELEWSFAAYTLGEVATVTLVSPCDGAEVESHFSSRTDLADLCTVPLFGYAGYCRPSEKIAPRGRLTFASLSTRLFEEGAREVMLLLDSLKARRDDFALILPHAATKRAWEDVAAAVGFEDRMYYVYPMRGNLASASVPAGMAAALEEGRLVSGDQVLIWTASAGMSFAVHAMKV